jgi:hypothetical protein
VHRHVVAVAAEAEAEAEDTAAALEEAALAELT